MLTSILVSFTLFAVFAVTAMSLYAPPACSPAKERSIDEDVAERARRAGL